MLDVLENTFWERRSASFYRFDALADTEVRRELLRLIEDDVQLHEKRSLFEDLFKCHLGSQPQVEVHRYSDGDGIGAHTDFCTPEVRWDTILIADGAWNTEECG